MGLGTTPEHENDFSVPRNSLDAMAAFINPVNWLGYSNCAQLVMANIVSSPMMSSVAVFLMSRNLSDCNVGMHVGMDGLLGGNAMGNDLKFMANELMYHQNNNSILMYSSSISYFQ